MKKYVADIITGVRIVGCFFIILTPLFSPIFWASYVLCGLSDVLDGFIARKFHIESEHGATLDTVCDCIFLLVCFVTIVPVISLPLWMWCWIGVIAVCKVFFFIISYSKLRYEAITKSHNFLNRITGLLLFSLPFTLGWISLEIPVFTVCVAATLAVLYDGFCLKKLKKDTTI